MPRPLQPLLSREAIIAATLKIIDVEGIEAFSMPRLAKVMGVRAPSLYHHFKNKPELMTEVARVIVLDTRFPRRPADENWPDFFVALSLNFRRSILRHRNAAPILLEYLPRDVLITMYERVARFLDKAGVPPHLHVLILDGMEKLSLGASLSEAMKTPESQAQIFPNVNSQEEPTLAAALAANEWSAEQIFAQTIRSFLAGVMQLDAQQRQEAESSTPRSAGRKA